MKKPLHLVVAITLLLCAAFVADKKLIYSNADAIGEWFGISEDEMYSARLVLRPDGTGMLALRYLDREIKIYRVKKWEVRGRQVTVEITPISPDATSFKLSVEIRGMKRLGMTISDATKRPKWRITTVLWKEELLLRDRDELVKAMDSKEAEGSSGK